MFRRGLRGHSMRQRSRHGALRLSGLDGQVQAERQNRKTQEKAMHGSPID